MLEHMRLAKMSFDLWGALSPVDARQPPGVHESDQTTEQENETTREASAKRTMSQAELESSLYKVEFCLATGNTALCIRIHNGCSLYASHD